MSNDYKLNPLPNSLLKFAELKCSAIKITEKFSNFFLEQFSNIFLIPAKKKDGL